MLKKNVLIRKLILYTHTTHTYQIFFKFRNRAKIYDVQSCFLSSVQYFTIYICSTFFYLWKETDDKEGYRKVKFSFSIWIHRGCFICLVWKMWTWYLPLCMFQFLQMTNIFLLHFFFSSPSPLSTFIFKILWKNFNFNEND